MGKALSEDERIKEYNTICNWVVQNRERFLPSADIYLFESQIDGKFQGNFVYIKLGRWEKACDKFHFDSIELLKALKEIGEISCDSKAQDVYNTYEKINGKLCPCIKFKLPESIADKLTVEGLNETVCISTGFLKLDKHIGGGLCNELYCLVGMPSIGRTTFALQLADHIAYNGHDVIYFSQIESKFDLITKSMTRISLEWGQLEGLITSMEVRKGDIKEIAFVHEKYADTVGDFLSIVDDSCSGSEICKYVWEYTDQTRTKPVVIIDSLQFLKMSEEENSQKLIAELKQLSSDLSIPVIAISGIDRTGYDKPISYESLQGIDGLEDGCDVLLGLQLNCMSDELFAEQGKKVEKQKVMNQAMVEDPRLVDLVFVKNRFGEPGQTIGYKYYPAKELFIEE